jgi:hypothetical protein
MRWSLAYTLGWIAVALVPILYELYAVIFGKHTDPPLTDVVATYIPWYITMPVLTLFLSWLWLHFAAQYTYPDWLKKVIGG